MNTPGREDAYHRVLQAFHPIVLLLMCMVVVPSVSVSAMGFLRPLLGGLSGDLYSMVSALIATVFQDLSLIYVTLREARSDSATGDALRFLGLRPGGAGFGLSLLFNGVLFGIGFVFLSGIGGAVSVQILEAFLPAETVASLIERERAMVSRLLDTGQPAWSLSLVLLIVIVLAPVAEEFFFRGFLYRTFRDRWGVGMAAVASTALFAAVHLYVVNFLPVFVIGIGFAMMYEKYRTLGPGIIAHASFNALVTWIYLAYNRFV